MGLAARNLHQIAWQSAFQNHLGAVLNYTKKYNRRRRESRTNQTLSRKTIAVGHNNRLGVEEWNGWTGTFKTYDYSDVDCNIRGVIIRHASSFGRSSGANVEVRQQREKAW